MLQAQGALGGTDEVLPPFAQVQTQSPLPEILSSATSGDPMYEPADFPVLDDSAPPPFPMLAQPTIHYNEESQRGAKPLREQQQHLQQQQNLHAGANPKAREGAENGTQSISMAAKDIDIFDQADVAATITSLQTQSTPSLVKAKKGQENAGCVWGAAAGGGVGGAGVWGTGPMVDVMNCCTGGGGGVGGQATGGGGDHDETESGESGMPERQGRGGGGGDSTGGRNNGGGGPGGGGGGEEGVEGGRPFGSRGTNSNRYADAVSRALEESLPGVMEHCPPASGDRCTVSASFSKG